MACVQDTGNLFHLKEVGPCATQRCCLVQIVAHSILPRWVLEVVANRISSRDQVAVYYVSASVIVFNKLFDIRGNHLISLIFALNIDIRGSKLFKRPIFEFVQFAEVVHSAVAVELLLE